MSKKLFVIETVSMHRIAYCIEASSQHEAEKILSNTELLNEFGQTHIGENIFYVEEVTEEDYLKSFDNLNDYLKDIPQERKLTYIMRKTDESEDR